MNVSALHLVSNPAAADSCLAAAAEGDAVLLVGDGVFAHRITAKAGIRFGVLEDDAASRGLEPPPGLEVLTYDAFVEWAANFAKTVTWR